MPRKHATRILVVRSSRPHGPLQHQSATSRRRVGNRPLRRELHPILKKLGLAKCGLHAFRHGRVSFLVENNVPVPVIRLWIGRGSDQTVARDTRTRISCEYHRHATFDCKHANVGSLKETMLNCLQSACGERSSAGRASVCGTEGRGFKSRRSPQSSQTVKARGCTKRVHNGCTP